MQNLNITLLQTELDWENAEANRRRFDNMLQRLDVDTDLIVLPEMFSTGFSMQAQEMSGETVQWLRRLSIKIQKQ